MRSSFISNAGGRETASRVVSWTALALVGAVAGIYAWRLYAPCDDTYIYLVYVKNLMAGNGLTFNGMRVQGFTSVLWVAMLALVGRLPAQLPQAAEWSSVAAGLLTLMACYAGGRRAGLSRDRALVAPALLATTGDFAFYMGSGLEAAATAAAVTWVAAFAVGKDTAATFRSRWFAAAAAAAILVRPEGIVVTAVVALSLWRSNRDTAGLARAGAALFATLIPVWIALRVYYGAWLPNTYYAKSGAGLSNAVQGTAYLGRFVLWQWPAVIPMAAAWLIRRKRLAGAARIWSAIAALWLLQATIQGGDNMVGFRTFLPVFPLAYAAAVVAWTDIGRRILWPVVAALAIYNVAAYNSGHYVGSSWKYEVREHASNWARYHAYRKDIGLYLKRVLPPDAVIAVNAAGVIPYYAERRTIDMLGLNNVEIARHGDRDRSLVYGHQVGDGDYVLSLKPDAILLGGAGSERGTYFLSDRQIQDHPDLKANYVLRPLPHKFKAYFLAPRPRPRPRP